MFLRLTAADKSDVGKQRDQNEDYAYKRVESAENGDRGLFIVADGMGGYKAGEVASRLAVETIRKGLDSFFQPLPDQPTIKLDVSAIAIDPDQTVVLPPTPEKPNRHRTRKLSETALARAVEEQLKNAIQQANREIIRYGEQQPSSRGLGSTVTVMLVHNDHVCIANVGDSRTYLFRDNHLKAITKDHSLVARLLEARQISEEEVYTHPQRNLIYRSLGAGNRNIDVDIFHEVIRPGDIFLLCSDGLWEMVRKRDLEKAIGAYVSPQKLCDRLIDMANESGGEDNITAVIVHVSAH